MNGGRKSVGAKRRRAMLSECHSLTQCLSIDRLGLHIKTNRRPGEREGEVMSAVELNALIMTMTVPSSPSSANPRTSCKVRPHLRNCVASCVFLRGHSLRPSLCCCLRSAAFFFCSRFGRPAGVQVHPRSPVLPFIRHPDHYHHRCCVIHLDRVCCSSSLEGAL